MPYFQFVTIDNIRVRYIDKNQKGIPLLLIHGLGGSIESWINNITFLSTKFRTIALDLPGFGLSDKPKVSYTINFYVNFLGRFLKRLHIKHILIVGSSLGGHIAVEFTLQNRNVVDKLVLISPAGSLPKSFKGTSALRKYVKITKTKSATEVKMLLSSIDNSIVDDSYAKIIYKRLSLPGAKAAFVSALNGSARSPRYTSQLDKITANILTIWGKEDKIIPIKFIVPFIKQSNCRIIMFEKSGHRPHVENPKLFNKVVKDFLIE